MESGGDSISIVKEEDTVSTQRDLSASKGRAVRSYYRLIETRINEGKDEIADATSIKFMAIMNQVENAHQLVSKPREQVVDAETLLGLTSILTDSVRSHTMAGVTPHEFISCLIRNFGQLKRQNKFADNSYNVLWRAIGSRVSPIFKRVAGCRTMIGPMERVPKQRKQVVRAKRTRSVKKTLPEELKTAVDLISDTDRNIQVMFDVLKRKKKAVVESLILNRSSFAQTIENLFALSFLVKDGRAHIYVEETGAQVVVPRNGPSAEDVKSGVAKSHHFLFRLDFHDWKLMKGSVPDGEEVMPQRYTFGISDEDLSIPEAIPIDTRFVLSFEKHAKN